MKNINNGENKLNSITAAQKLRDRNGNPFLRNEKKIAMDSTN